MCLSNIYDLIFPDTKNDIMAGTTDNTIIGKLIKTQNLVLDKTAFVFSQKKLLLNVKLISLFYLLLKCVNIHE